MGYANALGMAESGIGLDAALSWHFSANCFPPVPEVMIEPAKRAIALVQADDPDGEVQLPEGVRHVRFGEWVPAAVMVEGLHLEAFVDAER